MPAMHIPRAAVAACLPRNIRPQVALSCASPPPGENWMHEPKHDGHRLIVITDGNGALKLVSRNGIDRTALFRAPFLDLADVDRAMVLDGEIAVPDDRGVTHIDALNDAIGDRRPDRLAYFAFDLLYLDGHDLRRCAIEERKTVLRHVIDDLACERILYLDHVIGRGAELFERVRTLDGEGIVSKRRGRPYRGGESRDWLKSKVFEVGRFVVTGFQELGEGRLEALHVAEERDGRLHPAGQVRFGFAGRGLWAELDRRRAGEAVGGIFPVAPVMPATVKFFGRYKRGAIRDGVITAIEDVAAKTAMAGWSCDSDGVLAAFNAEP
ncbi:MAG TPA: hypothetical protein VFR68_09090 [Candidatus Dormibacteraeota bacterium]|nr:hypothetical protein [Candidatus Dormibacteraeota bacterium]